MSNLRNLLENKGFHRIPLIKLNTGHYKLRIKIANNGRNKYFKLFNEVRTTKYILDRSFGKDVTLY